jgi:enamine deaminase RidA (YjgF/YER057c/UK114 family)
VHEHRAVGLARTRGRAEDEAAGFLFLGAITPHDRAGAVIGGDGVLPQEVQRCLVGLMFFDVPERVVIAQAWAVYSELLERLAARGRTARDVVRQRIFVRDVRSLPAIERVMDVALGDWRPATTFVVMPSASIHPQIHLQLDAVASTDHGAPRAVKGAGQSRYPAAVISGDLLFTSGITGVDGADIDRFETAADRLLFRTERESRIYEQTLRTFANLEAILASVDAGIANVVKVNGWVDFPMREYGAAVLARRQFFRGSPRTMMASTGLAVGGVAASGALVEFDAIALMPSSDTDAKDVTGVASPIASPYVAGAVRAGGIVFTSGEIPVRVPEGVVMELCAQLDDGGHLRRGHLEPEAGIEARAWYVYRVLATHLERVGVRLQDVVHQTVFITDVRQVPALERIATLFFGATLPPTTTVPIVDTTPFAGAGLEIEVVARHPAPGIAPPTD